MSILSNLTTGQLQEILTIKQQIETLQSQLESIAGGGNGDIPSRANGEAPPKKKRRLSAAHKRKLIKALAKARRIRLAGLKAQRATSTKVAKEKKDRRSSPATRAKLAAAARARWARVKAEGKTTL
jgi:hypothetical protein